MNNPISSSAELIYAADSLIIIAGAGMGVDSGLPDFRGKEGFWNAYPALAKSHIRFTDIYARNRRGKLPAVISISPLPCLPRNRPAQHPYVWRL